MLFIQKFGGSSLADCSRLRAAAEIIAQTFSRGNRVVCVVSAQGDTTDEILKTALSLHPGASGRELDACLSAGEPLCAAYLALTLQNMGFPAVSLTGWQAGIHTDGVFGNSRIASVDSEPIRSCLERGQVPVVTGFQGIGNDGSITTLGRGGSDTTAAALAGALGADRCQIFTDVEGVYDTDPRKNPDAKKYSRLSYDQALRLIDAGAQVLHRRSVETARESGTVLEVLSSFTCAPGTLVGPY